MATGAGAGGGGRIAERLAAALAREDRRQRGAAARSLRGAAPGARTGLRRAASRTRRPCSSCCRRFDSSSRRARCRASRRHADLRRRGMGCAVDDRRDLRQPTAPSSSTRSARSCGRAASRCRRCCIRSSRSRATRRARRARVDLPAHGARARIVPARCDRRGIADPAAHRRRSSEAIRARIDDLLLVTEDFGLQLARAQAIARRARCSSDAPTGGDRGDATAVADFLRWLVDGGFVFLGYREYAFDGADAAGSVTMRPGSGLGSPAPRGALALSDAAAGRRAAAPIAQRRDRRRAAPHGDEDARVSPVHRRVRDGRRRPRDRSTPAAPSSASGASSGSSPRRRRPRRRPRSRSCVACSGRSSRPRASSSGSHDWREIVGVVQHAAEERALRVDGGGDPRATSRRSSRPSARATSWSSVREASDGERIVVLVVMPRSRISGEARDRVAALVCARLGVTHLEDHLHAGDVEDPRRARGCIWPSRRGDAVLDERTLAALRAADRRRPRALDDAAPRRRSSTRDGDEGAALAARFAERLPGRLHGDDVGRARGRRRPARRRGAGERAAPQIALDPEPVDGATVLARVPRRRAARPGRLPTAMLDHAGVRALVEDRVRLDPRGGRAGLRPSLPRAGPCASNPLDVARVGDAARRCWLAVRAQPRRERRAEPARRRDRSRLARGRLSARLRGLRRAGGPRRPRARCGRRSPATPSRRGCSSRVLRRPLRCDADDARRAARASSRASTPSQPLREDI